MEPAPPSTAAPLRGVRVVSTAVNLPGPLAASRLAALGASVTKVEPPSGDPLEHIAKVWYDELVVGQTVTVADLKDESGRAALDELLTGADLLITATRTAALDRLGLGWDVLHARHPRLCQVAVVGHPAPLDNLAGHDLTYQAAHGTLSPPALPRVLVADLSGSERAVSEGLAALVLRASTGVGSRREVALSSAAESMAAPIRHGLTTPDGPLGGALAAYGIYAAAEGHVAVAALEPHFRDRLLGLLEVGGSRAELAAVFATRTAGEWQEWARAHDVPLVAVAGPSQGRDRATQRLACDPGAGGEDSGGTMGP